MQGYNIYQDISERTDGDFYIGVVGPVRTGKSTFIKRFMDLLVIPNIENEHKRERAMDELPQSAGGKTIMTTEPKFIPNEAVEITLGDNATFKVRMIDCVGYIVPSALGHIENDQPRMVSTPWFTEDIPFHQAAEIGTKKVINEHSTIGLVVTTDGSICNIPRYEYEEAESRVINELKSINKPFIVIVNSTNPLGQEAQAVKRQIEEKHNVSVMSLNCAELSHSDINSIIENVLYEFPITEIGIDIPKWIDALDSEHYLKSSLYETIRSSVASLEKIRDVKSLGEKILENEYLQDAKIDKINLGNGNVTFKVETVGGLFYKILGETTGLEIDGDDKLIKIISELAKIKKEYDKIAYALHEVREKGYGIVTPTIDEMKLEMPEMVKHGGRYGVRLRASAPSIHMIRADVETEVSPIVGSEKQSEDLVKYLLSEFEVDPQKIWSSNIFGKSLHDLVNEGLHNKLLRMPEDAQLKLQETLQKIINEGSGGLICIIL